MPHTPLLPPCLPPAGPDLTPTLCRLLPQWPLGLESERTQVGLAQALLSLCGPHPEFLAPGLGLALWAWQEHPLSLLSAGLLTQAWEQAGLPAQAAPALAARLLPRLSSDQARQHSEEVRQLILAGEFGLAVKYLMLGLPDPELGLGLLAGAWPLILALDQPDLVPALLQALPQDLPQDRISGPDMAGLKDRLLAEWAVIHLPPNQALARVKALDRTLWNPLATYLEAELLLRLGQQDAARSLLTALWRAMPWQVNLTLKLHTLLSPRPAPASAADLEQTCVLAYSWNKADLLEITLDQVADSDIGQALVVVLDNGSTDRTPEVIRAARDRLGSGRFISVALPVNVGAPAARNWLLSLDEVRGRRQAAFLDDDVILPPDWLARLAAGARDHPDSGVIGCRIKSASAPHFLQSADYNLLPLAGGAADQTLAIYDNCTGTPDFGLFTYSRPAASVSGCCHLLRLDLMDSVGGFDLRYTPSQFDDLDRDLRLLAAGSPAFYLGDLEVRHIQFSSLAKAESPAKMGHVLGNKKKLEGKYGLKAVQALQAANLDMLGRDLLAKNADLEIWTA